jgi:hypothetical protein
MEKRTDEEQGGNTAPLKPPTDYKRNCEYQRNYNVLHADKIKEYQGAYYIKHKEQRIADAIARRHERPVEEQRAIWNEYRERNIEKIKERRKALGTYDCVCGSKGLLCVNKTTHAKSKKHINFIKTEKKE